MPDFNALLRGPQAAKLAGDQEKLEQLRSAPETQKIFSMLSQATGGGLEQAADSAAQGDARQLARAIGQLMADPEGERLVRQLREKFNQSS